MALSKGSQYLSNPNNIPVSALGSATPRSLEDRFAERVDVRDHGAVGDGVADDTAAVQSAISYAIQTQSMIFFPPGSYLVTSSLDAGDGVNILGDNTYFDVGGVSASQNAVSRLISDIPLGPLFTTSVTNPKVKMGLRFMSVVNISEDNEESSLFGFRLENSTVESNYFHSWHRVASEGMGWVTTFSKNKCLNIYDNVIDNGATDSTISDNYLSMSIHNPGRDTAAINGEIALTTIYGNFCDFGFSCVRSSALYNSKIIGNVFDYSPVAVDVSGAIGSVISNNTVTHCSREYADILDLPQESALRSTPWIGISIGNTARGLSIVGNSSDNSDILISAKSSNYSSVKTSANTVNEFPSRGDAILFDVNTSDIDGFVMSEKEGSVLSETPLVTEVSRGQSFYVGSFRYRKEGGRLRLVSRDDYLPIGSYSSPIDIDLSGFPNFQRLVIMVHSGDGFGKYSYKTYSIFKDSVFSVNLESSVEVSPSIASSSVVASPSGVTLSFSGTSANPTLGYSFLDS